MANNASEQIQKLQEMHGNLNRVYFSSSLSKPIITIERLSVRTLAKSHAMPDGWHIRFNQIFLDRAWERYPEHVVYVLAHEMIHQYQYEVLYKDLPESQHPKNWHNKDFKEWADKLGIPCVGRNMGTGFTGMPFGTSRNQKWQCGCGNSRTVWSTKDINAVCGYCNEPYREVN